MKKILFYIFLAWLCFGCVTQKKCYSKFPPVAEVETVETIVEIRDTTILGGTVERVVDFDTLQIITNQVYRFTDTSGKAELTFFRNEYGKLIASCTAKDQKIEALNKVVKESKKEVKVLPPLKVKFIPDYVKAILLITSLLALPTAYKLIKLFIFKIP